MLKTPSLEYLCKRKNTNFSINQKIFNDKIYKMVDLFLLILKYINDKTMHI